MLASLIPLFDDAMKVCAYSIFAQKENHLLNPYREGTGRYDGAGTIAGLEIVDSMGMETLSGDREVFIQMDNVSMYADLREQCKAPHDKLVLLLDNSVEPTEQNIRRLHELRDQGYKLAMRKLKVSRFEEYRQVLSQCEYILLDHKRIDINKARVYFGKVYPNIKLCAVNVDTQDDYDMLTEHGGYNLYEGPFFRMPVHESQTDVSPLKVTYIELLNVVNEPDFDLTDAADVIGEDAALVISLLEMVNHMAVNSEITSVRHAAAMLGQRELKKWINTAVTKELCADKPSEITRISMLRAKFAENLAPIFEMGGLSSELFLMGLFSVLDIMLGKTMEDSLKMVKVSKNISNALINGTGELAPVLNFVKEYENASWQEISRIMVLGDMDMDQVYKAYLEALKWYRDLIGNAG
ncbi:MAG: HDOD domain-containing protein [Butyrivibrio sp.]|nr:HDOD domain-containing protein [Butyrivibrio sp.]